MGRFLAVLGVVACVLLTGMTAAGAQSSDEQLDECLDISDEEMGMGPPSCTFDSQGNLISRDFGGGFGGAGQGIGFGTFLAIALVWAGIPLVIAAMVASDRGESMGAAVLLTLVLGWIGLGIVMFGQQRTMQTVGAAASGAAAAGVSAAGASAAPGARAGSTDAVAERLRRIDDLHAQGVITDEERAQRRDAVLNDL